MVTFAFLGNTLFLTILVSMLSTTFGHIVNDAPAEIQFRRAVMTLEGVKGDAIFAYPPPFNILAILLLVPLKFCVSPRWFHKIHVLSVRLINLPILLVIALAERRSLSPHELPALSPAPSISKGYSTIKIRRRFWERWRITTHSDISTVFEVPLPNAVLNEIAADDDMTRHLIRRQFARPGADQQQQQQHQQQPPPQQPSPGLARSGPPLTPQGHKLMTRRNSIAPFPGLRAELQGVLSESDEVSDITSRLETLEESLERIEGLLERLVSVGGSGSGTGTGTGSEMGEGVGGEGQEVAGGRRKSLSLAELNREAEEE
jgi:hypothetical protein